MTARNLSMLMTAIHDALSQSSHVRVLRLILSNFDAVPDSAPLRERVAMVLAERGRKKEAVEILELVGRHYANRGHSTRAIATAKQLQSLKPDTTNLLDHISTVYNIRSPFLDPSVPAPVYDDPEDVDLDAAEPVIGIDDLLSLAVERCLDKAGMVTQPEHVAPIPLLSLLPQDTFRDVLEMIEYEVFDQSQPVLEKGKALEELVWTASDNLVIEEEGKAYTLPSGALIGLSTFGQSGRAAEVDVMSQRGSDIVRLTGDGITQITKENPDFPSRLATLRRHAMTERLIQRHDMFQGLDQKKRVLVIEEFTGMRVQGGEVIIRQNTPSPGLFIILDGEVDIVRQDEDWEITIATLKAGDVFGEIGLIADKPAVAGCVMTGAGHLLHLPRADFHELARRYPTIQQFTARLADERLNDVVLSADDLAEIE